MLRQEQPIEVVRKWFIEEKQESKILLNWNKNIIESERFNSSEIFNSSVMRLMDTLLYHNFSFQSSKHQKKRCFIGIGKAKRQIFFPRDFFFLTRFSPYSKMWAPSLPFSLWPQTIESRAHTNIRQPLYTYITCTTHTETRARTSTLSI